MFVLPDEFGNSFSFTLILLYYYCNLFDPVVQDKKPDRSECRHRRLNNHFGMLA
jgi:hypothetical protein